MSILKRFIRYYKPYRGLFYADMVCALTVSCIDLAFPQILQSLTGGLFTRGAEEILHTLGLVALGLVVMYAVRYGCQ